MFFLLIKENINKSCHAYVSTRGKFMLPDDKKLNQQQGNPEKPLYLFVQSQDEDNVRSKIVYYLYGYMVSFIIFYALFLTFHSLFVLLTMHLQKHWKGLSKALTTITRRNHNI